MRFKHILFYIPCHIFGHTDLYQYGGYYCSLCGKYRRTKLEILEEFFTSIKNISSFYGIKSKKVIPDKLIRQQVVSCLKELKELGG